MDSEVNDFLFEKLSGELKGQPGRLRKTQLLLEEKFGVKLSRNAIRKRFARRKKSAEKGIVNQLVYEEEDDHINLSYTGDEPKNGDELLQEVGLPKDQWCVGKQEVKAWQANLGGGEFATKYSVWVRFERLIAKEPLWPVIEPISPAITFGKLPARKSDGIRRALVVGDAHAWYDLNMDTLEPKPYHDLMAMNIIVQVAEDLQPDVIILGGDMLDMPTFTDRFTERPEAAFGFRPALKFLHGWIIHLRTVSPNSQIQYIEGNHCKRLEAAIIKNIRAAHMLKKVDECVTHPALSVPNLLGLDKLGVEYIGPYPDGQFWINDNLSAEHGETVRAGSGNTVRKLVDDMTHSVITLHIHRAEMASKTVHKRDGQRSYRAMCPGCLCHTDGRVPAQGARQNWQQGFSVIEYLDGNEIFDDHQVAIYGGRCIFNGKVYRGEELDYFAKENGR